MKIGKIIHYYRKKYNMTQEELAFRLGISGTTVSKWENDLSYPDTSLLPKVANIFDISINQLFNDDFVLVSLVEEIIEESRNTEKYSLKEAIKYLEKLLIDYPENEYLKFEIARKYYLIYHETNDKEENKKAINLFKQLISSEKKVISEWSKHYLSLLFSKNKEISQAIALNEQLQISSGINPNLDNVQIKLTNDYENVNLDIKNHLLGLMQDYFSYWKLLYTYYYSKKMYDEVLREGLKYIGIINIYIGKDKSALFKELSTVYYQLAICYYKVNNKMRSDECFISALLYAKKYDELEVEILKATETTSLFREINNKDVMLDEITSLIKNNVEQEIKDKLQYFLTRIKF